MRASGGRLSRKRVARASGAFFSRYGARTSFSSGTHRETLKPCAGNPILKLNPKVPIPNPNPEKLRCESPTPQASGPDLQDESCPRVLMAMHALRTTWPERTLWNCLHCCQTLWRRPTYSHGPTEQGRFSCVASGRVKFNSSNDSFSRVVELCILRRTETCCWMVGPAASIVATEAGEAKSMQVLSSGARFDAIVRAPCEFNLSRAFLCLEAGT